MTTDNMKTLSLALTACLLTSSAGAVFGQSGPDIIWKRNAYYFCFSGLSISANSELVATVGCTDGLLWNSTNGSLLRTFTVNSGGPIAVALSPDGNFLFAAFGNRTVRLWRTSDGQTQWQSTNRSSDLTESICYAPNGRQVANGMLGGSLVLQDAQTGAETFYQTNQGREPIYAVVFSPDSAFLASVSSYTSDDGPMASLWDATNATLIRNFTGHRDEVFSVDFSPDGSLLATASSDGTARIWNVTNGICLHVMEGGGDVPGYNGTERGFGCIAKFSANGSLLLTLNNYEFRIWRVATGAYAGSIPNTGAKWFDVAKNGKFFAYGTFEGDLILARLPLVIDEVSRSGNWTILKWQGGSGLYQVQVRRDFTFDSWGNLGSPTTNTIASNNFSGTHFYRVLSLPNP